MKRILGMLLAGALFAPVLVAGPALAQNVLDPDKVAAALALGFKTDVAGDAGDLEVTSMLITNTGSTAIWLAAQVISDDRANDEECRGESFSCVLTAGETTQFVFTPVAGGKSELTFECSDPTAIPNSSVNDKSFPGNELLSARRGILFVTIEDAAGLTLSQNVLEGKSVVMNFEDGTSYALPAIPFQAIQPEAQDFNTQYQFDGIEYGAFPAVVTTSFHAPDPPYVEAELFLFTLDRTLSSTETSHAQAVVNYWNDDEKRRNASFQFDCIHFRDLDDIAPGFRQANLGSQAGHLELIPQPSIVNDGAHDDVFGNGDDTRRSGFMGWLIQTVETGGSIQDAAGNDVSGDADSDMSWANVLTASQTAVSPTSGDTETLSK